MKLFHTPLFLGITESEFETMKELHSMRSSFFFKNDTSSLIALTKIIIS